MQSKAVTPGGPNGPIKPQGVVTGWACFFCASTEHSLRECQKFAEECARDPARAFRCAGCNSPGICAQACPKRQYFLSRSNEWTETVRNGRTAFIRTNGPRPPPTRNFPNQAWPGANGRNQNQTRLQQAPSRPQWQTRPPPPRIVQLVQAEHAGEEDDKITKTEATAVHAVMLARAERREQKKERKAIMKCAQEVNGTQTDLTPRYKHTRAMVEVEGVTKVAIIDTGADGSLISARHVPPGKRWRPWTEEDGDLVDANQQGFRCLGRVALEVKLGPVTGMAQFAVVKGVAFEVLLGVDFLYAHEVAVSLGRHLLVFEAHDSSVMPLMGLNPRTAKGCCLVEETRLAPRESRLVEVCLVQQHAPDKERLDHQEPFFLKSTRLGPLFVPSQVTHDRGVVEVVNQGEQPLWLAAGFLLGPETNVREKGIAIPLGGVARQIQIHMIEEKDGTSAGTQETQNAQLQVKRMEPAEKNESSTDQTPEGRAIPKIPGKNSCLTPEESAELRKLVDRKSTRLNSSHITRSRMPSSA